MTRMFVAVLPPPEALEHLEEFLAPRQEARVEGGRCAGRRPEQWHVTLAFCEHVPDRAYDALVDRLAAAAARAPPVEARARGRRRVPRRRAGPAAVRGRRPDPVELERMATGARHAALGRGRRGRRPAVPAPPDRWRGSDRPVEATRWLRVLDTYAGPTWTVEELALVASHLGEGPRGRPATRWWGRSRWWARVSPAAAVALEGLLALLGVVDDAPRVVVGVAVLGVPRLVRLLALEVRAARGPSAARSRRGRRTSAPWVIGLKTRK